MTADETAQHLCERWMKSPERRQRVVAVDEMAAFMSGVKAVLEIEDWRPIERITLDDVNDTRTVLWNPCDGIHLPNITKTLPHEIERLKSEGVFTHFLKLGPPCMSVSLRKFAQPDREAP